jgi:histidyl-tRNA synthetase
MYKVKPKLQPQFETVDRDGIPFAVIIGANELKEGVVRVKDQNRTKEELEKEEGGAANGRVIKREELIGWLKERIASL